MKLIAAADRNWAIGRDNRLLVQIPADMQKFRNLTVGNVIVAGRKTFESFPGGKPLLGRINIVLTGQMDYNKKGIITVHSKEELWEQLKPYDSDNVFIVGGESVYRMMLPYCDTAYITKLDYAYEADTWMPNLDKEDGWGSEQEGEEQTCFDLIYHDVIYKNKKTKCFQG